MAGVFTKIPQSTFQNLQFDAGVLLKNFTPATPAEPADADIICATTGGITVNCTPTYSDFGEDIDNCPNNTKELKHLDGWDCNFATTALTVSEDIIKLSLGAATVTAADHKVVPRDRLQQTDFTDAIWWVGDLAGGGMAAVKLINALSTGGFQLRTTKNGKGQLALEITGHVSINDQHTVPMEFYVSETI